MPEFEVEVSLLSHLKRVLDHLDLQHQQMRLLSKLLKEQNQSMCTIANLLERVIDMDDSDEGDEWKR